MRVLYGYPSNEGYNNRRGLTDLRLQHINRLVSFGYDVKPFSMGYSSKIPTLNFKQLDRKWKWKDKALMEFYERFLKEIEGCQVFYNSVGINFHPEFVENIKQFTVFGCNDDPESSEILSKPVALAYDLCAIGNIAEVNTYKSWGVKNVEWQPMGFSVKSFDPSLTYEQILQTGRDIDLSMIIDKLSKPRLKRLKIIDSAFPNGHFYGRGWKRGYLPQGKEIELLQRSKIGINIHNSTGPINTRLFYLPANGVLQICDNKMYLNKVFELGKEVIGFDSIEECIDLCNYYLIHEEERRQIAANGWKRVIKDYNEIAVFERLINNINKYISERPKKKQKIINTQPKVIYQILSKFVNEYEIRKINFKKYASRIYNKF